MERRASTDSTRSLFRFLPLLRLLEKHEHQNGKSTSNFHEDGAAQEVDRTSRDRRARLSERHDVLQECSSDKERRDAERTERKSAERLEKIECLFESRLYECLQAR